MSEHLLLPEAIHVPRINNNDDEVKLIYLAVSVGSQVTRGQVVAHVETDKAVVDIEAGRDGYVLAILATLETQVKVGSIMMWLGANPDMAPPVARPVALASVGVGDGSAPTAKALALLQDYGLDAAAVPVRGKRLSVSDIEDYFLTHGRTHQPALAAFPVGEVLPEVAGELKSLKSQDRGMLSTVTWHRDVAVPGYVEIRYDPAPWTTYATAFGQQHALFLNPLLPLMAWQLVEIARDNARLNATIVGTRRYEYGQVNLGSTIQVGEVLYLAVVRDAARLGNLGFVHAMVDLQRRAASHQLGPLETQGTTVGFSSMARWQVARHIPVLSPNTALMVAHTVGSDGVGSLGATYDHRVMSGSDAASLLKKLVKPGYLT